MVSAAHILCGPKERPGELETTVAPMTLRVIVVDDEEVARLGIRVLAEQVADIEILRECSSGCEAIEAIRSGAPDLVFLDIQLPDKNGFEVIEELGVEERPYIVFMSTYDRYALRAFEVCALDYLLKPIDERRFDQALSKARAALARERESAMGRRFAGWVAEFGLPGPDGLAAPKLDRIPVKDQGRIVLVRVADIDWVEANGDYVTLHVGDKAWPLRESIGKVEARLAPAHFVRIHRSTLVNPERVLEMRPRKKGEFAVVLANGTELKLSRNYRNAIRWLAGDDL